MALTSNTLVPIQIVILILTLSVSWYPTVKCQTNQEISRKLKSYINNPISLNSIELDSLLNERILSKVGIQNVTKNAEFIAHVPSISMEKEVKLKVKESIGNIEELVAFQNELKETRKIFGRKLKIPEGSSLSLAVQLSRPDILPGLFFQGDAIAMDGVIETPLWFELDTYMKHVYENSKPDKPTPPPHTLPGTGPKALVGMERCYLYAHAESLISGFLNVPTTVAQACLARMICEVHALLSVYPIYANGNVIFELIRLFLTPSLGTECLGPYNLAEKMGRKKVRCGSYNKKCPLSLTNAIVAYFYSW